MMTETGGGMGSCPRPQAVVVWLTGLSGAGKTTIARAVTSHLKARGVPVEHLDGDVLRGIFPQTGFTREERNDHVIRVGFLASMLERHGVTVVCSFISPYHEARERVRGMCRHFIEVYVRADLAVCEARDVKGLYRKARSGEIRNFTGVNDPYEVPKHPEVIVATDQEPVDVSAQKVITCVEGVMSGLCSTRGEIE